jgi:hypothetical protein
MSKKTIIILLRTYISNNSLDTMSFKGLRSKK